MKIIWGRDYYDLEVSGVHFYATCFVRNEISPSYIRRRHDPKEVVRTVTADRQRGSPYMPRKFPFGDWDIIAVEVNPGSPLSGLPGVQTMSERDKFDLKEYGEVRIRTNATQKVEVWALDEAGGYNNPTGKFVDDYGYLFHWAPFSRTTLGCGRIGKADGNQAERLARLIAPYLAEHGRVPLKVV